MAGGDGAMRVVGGVMRAMMGLARVLTVVGDGVCGNDERAYISLGLVEGGRRSRREKIDFALRGVECLLEIEVIVAFVWGAEMIAEMNALFIVIGIRGSENVRQARLVSIMMLRASQTCAHNSDPKEAGRGRGFISL